MSSHPESPFEPVSPTWRLVLSLLKRLPQGAISRATGWLAERRIPRPLRGPLIGAFARVVGIRTEEAEAPPSAYPSIGAYFVRRLRAGVRTWPSALAPSAGDRSRAMGSPVDGVVGALGPLPEGALLQAKGLTYDAGALLGDPSEGALYHGGAFLTIYLSPRHYHRIHTPTQGRLVRARSIPGHLLPVNLPAVRSIPDLFPRNERMVLFIEADDAGAPSAGAPSAGAPSAGAPDAGAPDADAGRRGKPTAPVALVAVGAFNVGKISVPFDRDWVTNRAGATASPVTRDLEVSLGVGDEVAAFHLGSTVVLLFPPTADGSPLPGFHPALVPGAEIELGAPLFS
jgi:phosphatidylserine decarboxylase